MDEHDIAVVCFRDAAKARLVIHCGLDEHKGVMLDRRNVVELIDALSTALARMAVASSEMCVRCGGYVKRPDLLCGSCELRAFGEHG